MFSKGGLTLVLNPDIFLSSLIIIIIIIIMLMLYQTFPTSNNWPVEKLTKFVYNNGLHIYTILFLL